MREISAQQALEWLKDGSADIIDVREPAEYAAMHIAGACSIPLSRLDSVAIAPHAGRKLVMVCATGRRSGVACERLGASNAEVYSLEGGLSAWRAAGGAVIEGPRKVIPIERQVLAIAGSLVVLGIILSFAVHPYFLALSAFVGAGLTFAGLTGFCGMALVLARMPWNQRGAKAA